MGDYTKLVENVNQRLKEEQEVVQLSAEEQKQYFKGWMIAKGGEDSSYLANNVEDIANDFRDDMTPVFGEDSVTLDPAEFDQEIKGMNDILQTPDEEGDGELTEPTDDGVEAPVGDEMGEPVGEPAPEVEPEPEVDQPTEEEAQIQGYAKTAFPKKLY